MVEVWTVSSANAEVGQSAMASSGPALPRGRTPRIDSERLLSGGREVVIDHAGGEYRLRLTKNDKLILTR